MMQYEDGCIPPLPPVPVCGSVVVGADVLLQHHKNRNDKSGANKFDVKLKEGTTNTYKKTQKLYGNDSRSCAEVFWWHKAFVNRPETEEDEARCENM
jgi:hypothetical protein